MDLQFNIPTQAFIYTTVRFEDISYISPEAYLADAELGELVEKDTQKQPGWLASRYAVKLVGWQMGLSGGVRDICVTHDERRAPKLAGRENWGVSLSHSGQYGAAVISEWPVGIDVEQVREWEESTVRAFLTDTEWERVAGMAAYERNRLITWHWSVKEAYLKARGVGLRRHPRTVEADQVQGQSFVVDKRVLAVVWL